MEKPVQTKQIKGAARCVFVLLAFCSTISVALAWPNGGGFALAPGAPSRVEFDRTGRLASDVSISGVVTDDKGEGLPGVNVVIKGSTRGSTTDAQGQFTITVPDPNTVLVFSFVGYRSQEVTVGSSTRLTVKLVAGDQ